MKNVKLGRQVLNHVVAHPDEFNMAAYGAGHPVHPCMMVACLAGHALLFSGWTLNQKGRFRDPDGNCGYALGDAAADLLGLTDEECHDGHDYLFSGSQTNSEAIERFRVIVEKSEAEGVSHLPAPWPL